MAGNSSSLAVGELGVLQNLHRGALNGLIAEVTGGLQRRMLYCLSDPAKSEICQAYAVRVPGFPAPRDRITWCVLPHQIRKITDPDEAAVRSNVCERRISESPVRPALAGQMIAAR